MDFFLINLIFMFISLLTYMYFRSGVLSYCNLMKKSRTLIKKSTKGIKKFWLYTELQKKINLGFLYYLNYLFLALLVVYIPLVALSWIKWLTIPVAVVGVLLGLVEVPSIFEAIVYSNREEVGKSFVLFGVVKGCNGSSRRIITILDWLFCVVPLALYLILLIKF